MTLEQLVNEHHSKLNENDDYVLSFITQNMEISISQTVSELAKQANVSDSTIIRLTKKLGFKGYGEFRYYLKEEFARMQKPESIKVVCFYRKYYSEMFKRQPNCLKMIKVLRIYMKRLERQIRYLPTQQDMDKE